MFPKPFHSGFAKGCAVILALGSTLSAVPALAQATATARISGRPPVEQIQTRTATAHDVFEGASATGTVNTEPGINLGVIAHSSRPISSVSAGAIWKDQLRFGNPELYDPFGPFFGGLRVWFAPHVEGFIITSGVESGFDGSANVSFQAHLELFREENPENLIGYKSEVVEMSNPGTHKRGVDISVPGNLMVQDRRIAFTMALTANVIVHKSNAAIQAEFGHTASLPPLFITDTEGRYVPEAEGLTIVGASGLTYPIGLPGDFNYDDHVDAADYVVWREGFGGRYTQDDYTLWRNNFGVTAGASAAAVAIPEPAALVSLIACGLALSALLPGRGTEPENAMYNTMRRRRLEKGRRCRSD